MDVRGKRYQELQEDQEEEEPRWVEKVEKRQVRKMGGGVELNEGKQVVGLFVPELLLLLGSVEFPLQQSSWRGWCCAVYRGKRWTGKDVRQDVGGKV